jgi:hypothetical protein
LWAKHGILTLRQVMHTKTEATTALIVKKNNNICPWTGVSRDPDVFGQERLKQNRTVAKFRKVRTIFSRIWPVRPDTITKSAVKSGIRNMKFSDYKAVSFKTKVST